MVTTLAADLARRTGLPARVGFGAATALLPCGLLWSALAMAGATGAPFRGAVVMGAFWSGTVPALAVASLALRRVAASSPFARRAVAAVVFAAGLSAIVLRGCAPAPSRTARCPADRDRLRSPTRLRVRSATEGSPAVRRARW